MICRSFKGLEAAYQDLEFDSAKQQGDLLQRIAELRDGKEAAEDKARRTLRAMVRSRIGKNLG